MFVGPISRAVMKVGMSVGVSSEKSESSLPPRMNRESESYRLLSQMLKDLILKYYIPRLRNDEWRGEKAKEIIFFHPVHR